MYDTKKVWAIFGLESRCDKIGGMRTFCHNEGVNRPRENRLGKKGIGGKSRLKKVILTLKNP